MKRMLFASALKCALKCALGSVVLLCAGWASGGTASMTIAGTPVRFAMPDGYCAETGLALETGIAAVFMQMGSKDPGAVVTVIPCDVQKSRQSTPPEQWKMSTSFMVYLLEKRRKEPSTREAYLRDAVTQVTKDKPLVEAAASGWRTVGELRPVADGIQFSEIGFIGADPAAWYLAAAGIITPAQGDDRAPRRIFMVGSMTLVRDVEVTAMTVRNVPATEQIDGQAVLASVSELAKDTVRLND